LAVTLMNTHIAASSSSNPATELVEGGRGDFSGPELTRVDPISVADSTKPENILLAHQRLGQCLFL
jgi:hypothetical protein